ncbi:MAG: hypothetical protein ACPG47_05000 [Leucothrix sp.]
MKNTALISVSFLVLLGVSACSTSSQKPQKIAKKAPQAHSRSALTQRKHTAEQNWQAKQRADAEHTEQQRLAYNYAWQQQQQLNKKKKALSEAQARRNWQQQQSQRLNQERSRLAQQQRVQEQEQHRLAMQYAQQQMQQQAQLAQQQAQAQQQRKIAQQQKQQAQYLAMLRPPVAPSVSPQGGIARLSSAEIKTIGDKIFRNESGGDVDKLVHWNVGENFASMGIGHFTWYPAGRRNRFGNTFPGLLDHLQANGVQLPVWVQKARYSGAPWRTKNELLYAKNSPRLQAFQDLLYQTRYLQASYIFERAKRAMPRLVKATPPHLRAHVAQNLNAVANTRGGWYALIDYVNFKGEGLNRKGGYKGQNWGLLQVLENMRPSEPGQMALNNFADSAIQTLQRRVRNSNPKRGESRWMRGWTVRCNTYRQPFVI